MNLCLNAFVIQSPDGLLDIYSVTAPRALPLRYAHRDHCKDEDSYKECRSHVEFSIGLTRLFRRERGREFLEARIVKQLSIFATPAVASGLDHAEFFQCLIRMTNVT